ncbi:hypothetical protein FR932_10755 [Moritella marina ATCC 15381]|uniref:Uncharacterized protein n=1 Tax=Moritella marina ATCC 15381 TaxID=1202962 RepID=A0A5J6WM39_MORMI|nr:hypothetical protein [Moritella marina]QFI38291.1 hypothetical protein FR932_10755 [Moritella marina ATCC 15381]
MPYLITTEQYANLKSTIEDLLAPFDSFAFSDFVTVSPIAALTVKKADQLVTAQGYEITLDLLEQSDERYIIEAYYDITDNKNIYAINEYAEPINLLKNPSFTRTCSICNTTTNRSQGLIFSHSQQGDFCAHLGCVKKRLPELMPFATYLQKLPALVAQLEQLQNSVFNQTYASGAPLRLYLAIVEDEISQHGFISKQDAIQFHHDFKYATYSKAAQRYQTSAYPKYLSFEFVEKAILYTKQMRSTSLNDKLKQLCNQSVLAENELATATLIISNYIVNNQGLLSHQSPLATDKKLALHNDGSDISETLRLKGKLGDYVRCHITVNSCKYQVINKRYDIRGKDDTGRVVQFNHGQAMTEKSYIYVSGFISKFYQNQYGYTISVLKGVKALHGK